MQGIAARPFKNFVIITGYKYDEHGYSAAKAAGVRVGDLVSHRDLNSFYYLIEIYRVFGFVFRLQIIGASSGVLHSIADIQEALKKAAASKVTEGGKTFRIVVLRSQSMTIRGSKEVKEVAGGEKTFLAAFDAQITDDDEAAASYVESVKAHLVSRKEPPADLPALFTRRHFFREQRGLPGRLFASVVEILRLSAHAYATNDAWTERVDDYYNRLVVDLIQLYDKVEHLPTHLLTDKAPTLQSTLCQTMKTCNFYPLLM